MPQSEFIPLEYREVSSEKDRHATIHLRSTNGSPEFDFSFQAVKSNLFRVTFSSSTHPIPPYPSVAKPQDALDDVRWTRSSISDSCQTMEVGDVRVSVEWSETPVLSLSWKDSAEILHRDLKTRSYVSDGTGIAHYTQHDRNALHVGLGEKAAPMDLTGRHFQIVTTDCFGYDVYKTDPMYKHIPLLIKATPQGCIAMFSTTHSRGTWAVGSEMDGQWGHFKVYRQDYGGLEEYLLVGRTIKDVVRVYAELVGFPLLNPKWAYGYISGGYKYTMGDDPPAYQLLLDFADKLIEHDIPCSAHQMSSGYSIAEEEPKVRHVFTWNNHRFPRPEKWIDQYHALGIRMITNIKPYVLNSHPDYQYLKEAGALFTDNRTKKTADMKVWSAGGGSSGSGSHIDFTSAAAFDWWRKGVKRLKQMGVDGMWNDNNEYPLPNDDWLLKLDNPMTKCEDPNVENKLGLWGRTMHTELMGKASHDGLLEAEPNIRPFVLSRSATPGTLRYACSTWSGDNVTSWESMKGATSLSLTAGMSLLQNFGHDIGGFEGPQPSPELLLRWVQLGTHSIRFAINCFKTSPSNSSIGEVIEPWMYPQITPHIRTAIKRRYELLPYIYSLSLESHLFATPPHRWIGWDHECDPEVWTPFLKRGEEQYWFGDSILVGGVYAPGVTAARIYLPRSSSGSSTDSAADFDYGFVNMNAPYEYLASGQWATISSEWHTSIPLLAKIGCAIPIGKTVQTRMPGEINPRCLTLAEDDYRAVEIFPPQGSSHGRVFTSSWYEDDGMALRPDISRFSVCYSSTAEMVTVGFEADGKNGFVPAWSDVDFILHVGDERHVVSETGGPLEVVGKDERGRWVWRLRRALPNQRKGGKGAVVVNGHR